MASVPLLKTLPFLLCLPTSILSAPTPEPQAALDAIPNQHSISAAQFVFSDGIDPLGDGRPKRADINDFESGLYVTWASLNITVYGTNPTDQPINCSGAWIHDDVRLHSQSGSFNCTDPKTQITATLKTSLLFDLSVFIQYPQVPMSPFHSGCPYRLLIISFFPNRGLQRATWRPRNPVDDSPSRVCVDPGSYRCPNQELVTPLILEVAVGPFAGSTRKVPRSSSHIRAYK